MALLSFPVERDPAARIDKELTVLGLSRPTLLWATIAAVFIGVVYALSPMTIWSGLAMILLFVCAGRGLPDRERRWVFGVLAVALVLRVLAIAGFFLLTDHPYQHESFTSFFGDEDIAKTRSIWIRNVWLGMPLSPWQYSEVFIGYGPKGYHYLLAYLQVLLGPMPYGVHLLNAGLFLVGAVALYRMMRHIHGSLPALCGFSVLLFLPTLFVWSISAMKESLYFFLTVMALYAASRVVRAGAWSKRLFAIAVSIGAIGVISTLRPGSFSIIAFAVTIGLVAWFITRRIWLFVVVLLFILLAGAVALSQPVIQNRVLRQLQDAAYHHMGHVSTEGFSYKLLDQRFYSEDAASTNTMTTPEALRFVVRAAWSFVTFPLPWQVSSWPALAFLSQQVIWYVLVGLAAIGFPVGLRKDPLVTGMLGGYILIGSAVIALMSGNIGSLVRHRDMVVPYITMLGALGAHSVLMRLVQRTCNDGSEERVAT